MTFACLPVAMRTKIWRQAIPDGLIDMLLRQQPQLLAQCCSCHDQSGREFRSHRQQTDTHATKASCRAFALGSLDVPCPNSRGAPAGAAAFTCCLTQPERYWAAREPPGLFAAMVFRRWGRSSGAHVSSATTCICSAHTKSDTAFRKTMTASWERLQQEEMLLKRQLDSGRKRKPENLTSTSRLLLTASGGAHAPYRVDLQRHSSGLTVRSGSRCTGHCGLLRACAALPLFVNLMTFRGPCTRGCNSIPLHALPDSRAALGITWVDVMHLIAETTPVGTDVDSKPHEPRREQT